MSNEGMGMIREMQKDSFIFFFFTNKDRDGYLRQPYFPLLDTASGARVLAKLKLSDLKREKTE